MNATTEPGILGTDEIAQTVSLDRGAMNLGCHPLVIRIVGGTAWVTHDNTDIVVQCGEQITLLHPHHPIVISSTRRRTPLEFAVSRVRILTA